MNTDWSFENLFATLGLMRMGFGIIFVLFVLLFVAVIVEELFLGGRKRRRAEKEARLRQDAAPRPKE
jgi:ribose 5-phosphate isomerase RpiB